VDLYHPQGVITTEVSLGDYELTTGKHRLTIKIVGANKKSDGGNVVGVAAIKCAPVDKGK
jgi:hypothetical protein